jgi:hypothetical protein
MYHLIPHQPAIHELSTIELDPNKKTFIDQMDSLYHRLGSHFQVSYGEQVYPIHVCRTPYLYDSNKWYYVIQWDQPVSYDATYHPFKIECLDLFYTDQPNPNHCYIKQIRKTDTISGKQMISFVLSWLKHFGATKVCLHDVAMIQYQPHMETSLSWYTLCTYGRTYYQSFGFQLMPMDRNTEVRYGTKEIMQQQFQSMVEEMRGITVLDAYERHQHFMNMLEHETELQCHIFHISAPGIVSPEKQKDTLVTLQFHGSILHKYLKKHKKLRTMFVSEMLTYYLTSKKGHTYVLLKHILFEQPIYKITRQSDGESAYLGYSSLGIMLETYMKYGRWYYSFY